MKINKLSLSSFRGIKKLDLELNPQLTLLIGANGTGKTSVLDALSILLSWVVARVRRSGTSGQLINDLDIQNKSSVTLISVEGCTDFDQPKRLAWRLVKTKAGHLPGESKTELSTITDYAKYINSQISNNLEKCNIPLFAHYKVNRAVLDIPLRIRKSHTFDLLEAWDNSLTSASNFRSFFEWFRNREDLENEIRGMRGWQQQFLPLLPHEAQFPDIQFPDIQLEAVRKALNAFLPEFSDFAVRRNPLRMITQKQDQEIQIDQLSDGEKCLIALIGDLARRLAIANPARANPLEGTGVVIIDEIELHLHPKWQRMVLPQLIKTFPNCQFVISTHSPQVISEIDAKHIRIFSRDQDQQIQVLTPKQSLGLTSNEILDELMQSGRSAETLARNIEVEKKLHQIFEMIDQGSFEGAKANIKHLKLKLHGDIPDLIRAEAMITMLS